MPKIIMKGIHKSMDKPGGVGPGGGGGVLPSAKAITLHKARVTVKKYLKFIKALAKNYLTGCKSNQKIHLTKFFVK